MIYVNCTPHEINLNDGREYPKTSWVARVEDAFTDFDENGICEVKYGEITGLPRMIFFGTSCGKCDWCDAEISGNCENFYPDEIVFIVSGKVLDANKMSSNPRVNIVAPATGHPDAIRNDKGHIVSVPGFVR